MKEAATSWRADRVLLLALSALVLLLLGLVAFRALGRAVEPVEAKAEGAAADEVLPSAIQPVQSVPERDAIEASTEQGSSPSNHASAATGAEVAPPEADEVIVWGFVRDRDGQPVESAGVSFVDSLGEWRSADVAADGSYSMPGLEPGRWFVRAAAQGFLDEESSINVPAARARVQRDFRLEPRPSLSVRVVTPDGRAFRDADVDPSSGKPRWTPLLAIATTEPPKQAFIRFNHNSRYGAGSLRFFAGGQEPPGLGAIAQLDLFDPLPLFVSLLLTEKVLATQEVAPGSTEVVFVLDPSEVDARFGELRLTFVDGETRAPVTKAHVFVDYSGASMSSPLDSEGRIVLKRRPPGRYQVQTWRKGFFNQVVEIDLSEGEVLERTIELDPGVQFTGRTLDELGRPMHSEFQISWLPAPGQPPRHSNEIGPVTVYGTESDGTFDFRMEPGVWLLQPSEHLERGDPSQPRLGPNVVVDTRFGSVTNEVIRFAAPGILVASWSGAHREVMQLRFLDEKNLVRCTSRFWSFGPNRIGLPQGNWQVQVLDAQDVVVEERSFTLGSDPVVLELGRGP